MTTLLFTQGLFMCCSMWDKLSLMVASMLVKAERSNSRNFSLPAFPAGTSSHAAVLNSILRVLSSAATFCYLVFLKAVIPTASSSSSLELSLSSLRSIKRFWQSRTILRQSCSNLTWSTLWTWATSSAFFYPPNSYTICLSPVASYCCPWSWTWGYWARVFPSLPAW